MREVTLWHWKEGQMDTEKACLYSKLPASRHPTAADLVWVPRSLVEHRSKRNASDLSEHILKLPEWWLSKEGL